MIDPSARVHGTADIESDVSVGQGTSIWHRVQIRTGAKIGAECVIGRDAFIDEGVTIGDRVKIQNAALVYHGVTVEDGVFIGPGAILTNDRYPRAITSTGDLARAEDWTVSPITLRYGSSIGAGAVVVAGVEVGRFATVGRRRGRHPRRPEPRARRRQPGPPDRLGLRLRHTPRRLERRPGPGRSRSLCRPNRPRVPELRSGLRLRPRRRDARGAFRPTPGSARMIPIARPDLGSEEIAAVTEVLHSGMIAQGRKVAELEGLWADFVGVRHAIAVGNGTLALMAIFAGIGLEPGDEVITVSHTFAATANAIL